MAIEIIPSPPILDSNSPGGGGGGSSGSLGGAALSGELYTTNVEFDISTGGTETNVLLFRNPLGSGKRMFIAFILQATLHHSDSINVRTYRSPVVTATGTVLGIEPTDIGGTTPPSAAQSFSGPTVSSKGTRLDTVATGKDQRIVALDWKFARVLEPGQDLLITGQSSTNNKNLAITVLWAEVTKV